LAKCRPISREEQAAVEAVLLTHKTYPERDRCLLALGIETGLRITELLSIRFQDVFRPAGEVKDRLIIQKRHCKGGKHSRRVMLSPAAKGALERALTEAYGKRSTAPESHLFGMACRRDPMSRQTAYQIISSALKQAGVTHTRGTHTMRKTRAQRVGVVATQKAGTGASLSMPLCAVRDALGHASIQATEKYMESAEEEVNQWTANGEI
jgi:integrase